MKKIDFCLLILQLRPGQGQYFSRVVLIFIPISLPTWLMWTLIGCRVAIMEHSSVMKRSSGRFHITFRHTCHTIQYNTIKSNVNEMGCRTCNVIQQKAMQSCYQVTANNLPGLMLIKYFQDPCVYFHTPPVTREFSSDLLYFALL